MNKNIVIGGLVLIILLAGGVYYMSVQPLTGVTAYNPDGTPIVTTTDNTTVTPAGDTVTADKPVATTNATVAPTDTTVVVTGTVVPKGAITTYWYEYGTTNTLGKKTSAQVVGSGYVAIATPGYITGLTKNTTYYFQLVAENQYGRSSGGLNAVTTTSISTPVVGGIPTASTVAASGITASSANLKGNVNPNKVSTLYWFEYGTQGTFGSVTAFTNVGSGSASVEAAGVASNLKPGTTYYYRVNAQNQFGTVNGAILTFKTAGAAVVAEPVVTTQVVTSIAPKTALLRGTVNPYGTQTSYWFEYATNANFGGSTKTTSKKSAGAVTSTVSVDTTLTGLNSNTTYYVRIVAENSGGTVKGSTETFKTL